jgi:hypothetical protein
MVTRLDPLPLPPPVDRRAAAKAARKEAAESRVTPGAVRGTDPGPHLPPTALEASGWPTMPGQDARNFTDARPMTLAPGTKIYRIIDDGSNPAGSYWAFSIPPSEAAWRGGNAVLDSWNNDGQYVEYEVPPGPGLNVWAGGTAGQMLGDDGDADHVLPGGEQQIWMPSGAVTPSASQPTPWAARA